MKPQYTIRKFNGDDSYSWAVFRKSDIPKGRRGVIFWGEAQPLYCGLSRSQAGYYKNICEKRG